MMIYKTIQSIKTINTDKFSNVVFEVVYKISMTIDGVEKFSFLTVELDSPKSNNFLPYDELTESQVIDWVEQKIGFDEIDALIYGLKSLFNEKSIIVPQQTELPWRSK